MFLGPAIEMWTARRNAAADGSADADLRFGPLVTGLSASASGNSAFVMVGSVSIGYAMGVSALWIAAGFWIGDIFFWYFVAHRLVKRVQDEKVDTVSEMIARISVGQAGLVLRIAALLIICAVGLYCVAQFLAIGKVLMAFVGLGTTEAMAIAVGAGLLSVMLGGLGSSVLVNVFQASMMILAATLIIVGTLFSLTVQPDALFAPNEQMAALLDPFAGFTPLGFVLFLVTFILQGFFFAMLNPHVLTRVTKGNVSEIKQVRWVYMGFMQLIWWSMTLVGVGLAALGVAAHDPDSAITLYSAAFFPAILLGVIIAGIGAASLSTGEAQLLVITNALVRDLVPGFFEKLDAKAKHFALIAGRIVVAIGVFFVLIYADLAVVGQLVIQSAALVCAAFALPVILFILNKRVSGWFMAFLILAGVGSTMATRASGWLTGGQELLAGTGVLTVIAAVAYFTGMFGDAAASAERA